MGEIRETLILADQFSNSFSRFLDLGNTAIGQMERIDQSVEKVSLTMRKSIGGATGAIISNMRKIGESSNQISALGFERLEAQLMRIADNTAKVEKEQEKHNKKVKETNNSAEKLLSTIKNMVVVAAGFTLGKKIIGLADEMTQTAGRLSLMVDENETVAELQDKIYASAQRSRASYQDTADAIAKMGLNAGNAFQSNDELIAFMEQVNKQFVIGGASSQQMSNAMVQLTQAMASGALRGEELGSILDVAPGIARNIEKAMGWAEGSIKSYAEEGAVSAGVVKYALLAMAEETNAQFDAIPKTWGQAFTQLQGIAVKSFEPVSEKINQFLNSDTGETIFYGMAAGIEFMTNGASKGIDFIITGIEFIGDNWEVVSGILIGAAIAIGAAMVLSGTQSMLAWIAATWPFILIAVLVAAVIYGVLKAGATFEQIGGIIGAVFGGIYAVGYNLVADLWNLFASFAEFFANVLNDPAAAIAHLVFDLFDSILGMVETVANAIDALVGTNMTSAVSGFREKMNNWVDDTFGENAIKIERMAHIDTKQTAEKGSKIGTKLGKKMDNIDFSMESIKNNLEGFADFGNVSNIDKVGKVGKIEKDVNLADENIKLLKDMSERQYVALVNVTMPQTNVSVNQNVTGGSPSDMNMIADYLAKRLEADREAHSSLNYG